MSKSEGTLEQLVDQLATELRSTAGHGMRVLGFTGPPGVGKSEAVRLLGLRLADAKLGVEPLLAGILPLDGFHKSGAILAEEELSAVKGSPDSFDLVGYLMMLDRLHARSVVAYAPDYRRDLHEPIAAAHRIAPRGIVLTEGNYLALQDGAWAMIREQIDLLIYLSRPEKTLRQNLMQRRLAQGEDEESARSWIDVVDAQNILTVEGTRARCDRLWELKD